MIGRVATGWQVMDLDGCAVEAIDCGLSGRFAVGIHGENIRKLIGDFAVLIKLPRLTTSAR
jgi:hypothetical protein